MHLRVLLLFDFCLDLLYVVVLLFCRRLRDRRACRSHRPRRRRSRRLNHPGHPRTSRVYLDGGVGELMRPAQGDPLDFTQDVFIC